MPYEISWESQGVYRRYFGDVSAGERHASLDAICSDPRFDSLRYTITDYLDVGVYEQSIEDTELVAAKHIGPSLSNPRIVVAAVAARPDIIEAIEHFITLGMTDLPYRIFSSVDAARQWIASNRARHSRPRLR
jgi:hypothetical protein